MVFTHTHIHLTLKLTNLIWKTCVDLFFQTYLTFNGTSIIYQQQLSCQSANITHDIRVSTCVLTSPHSRLHTHRFVACFLTSGSFFFDLAPPGCACVCVFWDEAEQDVRRHAVTLIYDAVLLVCVCLVCFVYIH
jgi:hypothetical protein